ncbi:MAG: enoyl-CoA hydratase/isomerase family protein [Candidatus Electryonea clarkiae]|nr:enoyl-CoA hydratase/isomerase family protein [Candidatus Electryonea clarkiae]MDP8287614.1 enoyl-CoA hydratase/isomerase family protein [Candidatus Electryonea clarkiae]
MANYKHIRVELNDGRADVILDRPPVNILNISMMHELSKAFLNLSSDKNLCAVVIRSEGKAFSAGVDVAEHSSSKVKEMIEVFGKMFKRLWEIPAITFAAVDGKALGGGCELAIGCDLVLASEKAVFAQPEIKVGVFAPMAAVVFPKLIGRNGSFEFLMSGDDYSASQAEKIGLVNRVFPTDDFYDHVDEYVGKFTKHSAAVIAITKRAIDKTMDKPARDGMTLVDMMYLRNLMKMADAQEGINAFLEKRAPVWKNR